MKTSLSVLALCIAPALCAQHFEPRPDGALLRVAFDGPARFAAAFAGTNFHTMCTSKGFTDAYAPVTSAIQEALDAMKGQAPFDPHAVYAGILAYAGRIEFTLGLEMNADMEPTVWAALSMGSDGKTDLATVCKEIERLALDAGAPFTDRNIGGQKWLSQDIDDFGFITLPRMVGDRAVILGGSNDGEPALAAFFPRQAPAEAKAGAPISISFDMPGIVGLIGEVMEEQTGEGDIFRTLVDAIGFANLADVTLDIDRVKRFLDMRMTINSKGPRRGLLAMAMPPGAKLPAIVTLVQQSPNWSVMPFDFGQVLPMIGAILENVPAAPMDLAQIEALALENTGVRLREDIFNQLGSAVLLASHDAATPTDANPLSAIANTCLGLELRDGAAFARSLETMLERAGVLEMRKTEKYRDTDVHRVTIPGVGIKVHWATTDRLLLIGVGDGGRAQLGGILDAAAAAARGEAPPELAKDVRDRLEVVPANYAGVGVQKFGAVFFDALVAALREGGVDGEIDLDAITDVIESLRGLFGKHSLEHAVSVTYLDPERAVSRTIW